MSARGTLDALIVPIGRALGEVGAILGVDDGTELMTRLGYKLPEGSDLPALFTDILASVTALTDATEAIVEAYSDGSYEDPGFLDKVSDLIEAIVAVARTADGLPARAQAAIPDADFLQNAGLDALPLRLMDYLIVTYLAREHPQVDSILSLLGVVTQTAISEGDYNPAYEKLEVRWDRIPQWFSDPKAVMGEEYGWNRDPFLAETLIARFGDVVSKAGFTPFAVTNDDIGTAATSSAPPVSLLEIPLFSGTVVTPLDGLAGVLVGVSLRRQDDPADPTNSGIALEPFADGQLDLKIEISEGWSLDVGADLAVEGLALSIQPKGANLVAVGVPSGTLRVGFARDGGVLGPLLLFGNTDSTRLEIETLGITVDAEIAGDGTGDVGVEFATKGFRLVIVASEGDGFLSAVLPKEPLVIGFDLTIGASQKRGVYFVGGAGFDYTYRLNEERGPVFVDSVDLGLKIDTAAASLTTAATGGLMLGPLTAVVQDIGLQIKLDFGTRGNLGNANLGIAFKPPGGIGLSLDTPTVKAGGFLSIDVDRGRYIGALELSVLEKFDLTAIAIITTRRPDGSEGFSLLFLISLTLPAGIPLGYNFYFMGAGGMLGLNRSVDLDRLREGIRTGTADNVLFPSDIVRRIDAIVADLETCFPQAENQFLIGPMALITWSSPALISVKLGVIIEIGTPVRIAVLGVLRAALPDEDDPILDLKVAFLGAIDFEAGLLSFDASIYDSYIGRGSFKLYIEGDIALRVSWGKQPDFVTSVGGFHPSYSPPAHLKLPKMRRLSLSLLKDNPRVTLSTYIAITTNTVQFGARLDLYFSVASFSIVGEFGFDVLFQFSPFHIDAHVYAGLAIRAGDTDLLSVQLDFRLIGPNPWIVRGSASLRILFFEVTVQFEKRFGEEALEPLPDVEVLPKLINQLNEDASWQAQLGANVSALVILRPLVAADGLVIDAAGRLTVRQQVLPLDTEFTLFGTSRPTDTRRVRVTGLRIGGKDEDTAPVFDSFAPAAFREMKDQDKLSSPAYERRPCGIQVTSDDMFVTDFILRRPVAYEMIWSDSATGSKPTTPDTIAETDSATFSRQAAAGAASRSPQAQAKSRRDETGKVLDIRTPSDRYAVTSRKDLRPLTADGAIASPLSTDASGRPVYGPGVLLARSDAEQRRAALAGRGTAGAELQVVPEAQVAA
ncbi:MAG: hypothetical protein IOD05_07085 [Rhodobacter sp.]|nr:hypothetical protein [Rhodobacter sp.]